MSSAGPVLLGRVRCALDGPVKAAVGDVDVTDVPGSPSELDSPIRSRDQSQNLVDSEMDSSHISLCGP